MNTAGFKLRLFIFKIAHNIARSKLEL